jgi:hypothetical protein
VRVCCSVALEVSSRNLDGTLPLSMGSLTSLTYGNSRGVCERGFVVSSGDHALDVAGA